jgi:hypothetical protein
VAITQVGKINSPVLKWRRYAEKNLDLQFAINISGNSPFGTPTLTKNAKSYEW